MRMPVIAFSPTGIPTFPANFHPASSVKCAEFYYCLVALATVFATLGTTSVFFSKLEALQYYAAAVAVTAVVPTVLCYLAVKRYFKNISCSDDVKRMQTKLSHGFLLQLGLLLSNVLVSLIDVATYPFDKKGYTLGIIIAYDTLRGVIVSWQPALIGFVICWSTSGLFQKNRIHASDISLTRVVPAPSHISNTACFSIRLL
ncbi:hypothetical protein Y032_0002g733 [Ancylostoma ceylanicum]|uniref:Uncharacterized protein n=2 Tax=Ancylostoma ceylanicum TaxID=53326 RepID=A0A016W222_9BILA|nr:hypothetical protein Y032_0002g733 [Ancylostoma ceylanicum]